MFGQKKQKEAEVGASGKNVSMKIETMEGDLKDKPISEKSFFINTKSESGTEKKLPVAENNKLPNNLTLKGNKDKPQEFKKPEHNLSSRYLPNEGEKFATNNPFLSKDIPPKITITSNKAGAPSPSKLDPSIERKTNNSTNQTGFKSNAPLTAPQTKQKVNWAVMGTAIVVFLVAISAGAYYYFFIIKKPVPLQESPINNEPVTIAETEEPDPNINDELEKEIPESLVALPILEIKNENIFETITALNEGSELGIENGIIYEPLKDLNILDAKELLQSFEINFIEIENYLTNGWIFVKKSSINGKKDIGLLLQTTTDSLEVKNQMTSKEFELVALFKNLYFDQEIPNTVNTDGFSQSEVSSDFRFYNFIKDNPSLSLDWGVINLEEKFNIIIISTSKNSTQVILNLLGIQ